MKKNIKTMIILLCIIPWAIRYYSLNGTFLYHDYYPKEIYSMNQTVEFDDCYSYNVISQPGYSISVDNARIVSFDEYLKRIDKKAEDFHEPSEKYLELTLTVSNKGDYQDGLYFYSLPVNGTNWYTFYDNEMTACINTFFENNFDYAHACAVEKNKSVTLKIAYKLYENKFLKSQWQNLNYEDMWLWVTLKPTDKRITISL